MELLAKRTKKFFNSSSFLQDYASKLPEKIQYDPVNEKNGFIDLGVSENKLMIDIIIDRFLREDMKIWLSQYQYYFNFQGILSLREAVADFFQERFVINNLFKINPENIVITNGATTCFSMLSYCIANPNEFFLIETPYYSAISMDVNCLTDNHVYCVKSKSENNFIATLADYEEAMENAKKEKKIISAIFIVTPGNPIGNYSSKERILDLLRFAKKYNLHVVIDEIYANCIYDKKKQFKSILSFYNEIPDPMRTHFMWSFSKDFCSAGLRCGVIFSKNDSLIYSMSKMGIFFQTSCETQHKLSIILNDKNWLNSFFEKNHEKMIKSKNILLNELKKLNVKVLDSCSGFFIWVDFRRILSPTLNLDELTFEREKQLFQIIFNNNLYIVPGQALECSEPGWFRIIFCTNDEFLIEGVKRLKIAIEEFNFLYC